MAKKSTSAAKKSKPTKAKASAKAVKKPVLKTLKKLVAKVVKKVTKPAAVAKAAPAKVVKKTAPVKAVEKVAAAKPAMMTKKGKATPAPAEAEVTSDISVETASDVAPAKAEKVSKVKPIRIEKGNLDDEKAKWSELFKKYGKDKAISYKMSDTFAALSPVQHKVLGWGFILKNDNDRLEVLFETGIRMLISNYKA